MAQPVGVMLPLATTTISVLRSDQDGTKDDLDGVTYATLASGIRAVIGEPSGTETNAGGSSEDVLWRLDCEVTDLRHGDRILDETTGETFAVVWSRRRIGLGLNHTVAGLRTITDRVST